MPTRPAPQSTPAAAQAAELLRAHGLPATAPRVAILTALRGCFDHPSPEALHGRVRSARPNLSLATVYKALHAFVAAGLVHEVSVAGDNHRRFDGNREAHHHLVCTVCHDVRDFEDERLARVAPPGSVGDFTPQSVSVHVLGRCARCAGASVPAPTEPAPPAPPASLAPRPSRRRRSASRR
jgi:Fe2+ or Zn2+ uptake regulation protein